MRTVSFPTQEKLSISAILRSTQSVCSGNGTDMHDGVDMSRNFGLSAREDRAGAHIDPLSPRHAQGRAHSISSDDREFAVCVFLILFVGMPCIFMGAVYLLLT
jgi:hypothetical protein